MNEGLLCEPGHKFNTSFRRMTDGEGLRLEMGERPWLFQVQWPKDTDAGAASHAQPETNRDSLALPHLRQKLQNASQEMSQDMLAPGAVIGPRKASARV